MPNHYHDSNLAKVDTKSHITYLKRQELEAKCQVTKTTIYSWIKTQDFPAPIHFGANLVRWNSAHVAAWETKKEAS